MSYRCSICGVSFAAEGSTIAHVVGSTSGDHSGVGFQSAGEFVDEHADDGDRDADSTQETSDAEAADSGADPDGGRSEPVIPSASGSAQSRSQSETAADSAPCCENCGGEELADLEAGLEFDDAQGVSHVTDPGDVQCGGCGWVGEPR